jgi:hypothetical protein
MLAVITDLIGINRHLFIKNAEGLSGCESKERVKRGLGVFSFRQFDKFMSFPYCYINYITSEGFNAVVKQ